jgi:trans-aconitate methyltransferase
MELSTAVRLIEKGIFAGTSAQRWADLGAGTGLFTRALSALLPKGSVVYAVDKNREAINSIKLPDSIKLKLTAADIEHYLDLEDLDGIIMANALHFVKDKATFIDNMRSYIRPKAHVIIIEYNTSTANQWVPYPLTFDDLREMMLNHGFDHVIKIGEEPSRYNVGNIYSALIT